MGASPTTYHQQFIHGTQYIDEVVMVRAIDKGDLYIHQDANWNVIGTTDLAASIVERNVYTPYGQLTVNQETSYGDRDGDGDVDATDKGTPGSTCTGTVTGACRILDLDFDGDYDSTDATKFDALTQGIARHQGRTATATNQPFAHQGLLFEPEIGSYQNRHRQYVPSARRFVQRDPLALKDSNSNVYQDGLNIYAYTSMNPNSRIDPSGLGSCFDPPGNIKVNHCWCTSTLFGCDFDDQSHTDIFMDIITNTCIKSSCNKCGIFCPNIIWDVSDDDDPAAGCPIAETKCCLTYEGPLWGCGCST